jgi:GH35 family endo-1,4-beta-xylanase
MKQNFTKNYLIAILLLLFPLVSFSQVPPTGLGGCKNKYLANIIAGSVPSNYNSLWNGVTSENDCKWGSVEPSRDVYNWTGADRAYNHAKNNGLIFRWHAIAWGSQYPNWISGLSPADLKAEVEEYMVEIAKRYPNSIDQIDVLNENLRTHAPGTGIFRDGLGGLNNGVAPDRGTGYDWIVWLFRTARKHFPNSKLILNDYGLENDQSAINEQLLIIKVLKDRGLVDGFGTQAHEFNINTLSAAQLKSSLDLMATGGVPIYVTELDISGDDAQQNTRYQTLFPVYWNHPNVAGITLWGYEEGKTWKANTQLIRSNGTDRPAMTWLKSFMAAQPNTGCGNTPPTVSITSPINNASFTAPASITINATAADANGTVSNVQFYNGTTLLGSDATSPYSFTWTNVTSGTYSITARATDNAGAVTNSAAISVTVTAVNTPPTVNITAPVNNASFTAPASITIAANAADANGTVSSVQFFNGTTLLGTDNTSPYSFAWTGVAEGTYSLTARATDNAGAITNSAIVSITVNPPVNTPPTVSITAPANNASFTAPANITITANAADANGTVSSVQFFNGTTLLGTDNTSPYSFAWASVAAGAYSITAVATDNNGASTTSSVTSITVNPPSTAIIIQAETACTVDGTLNETINTGFNGTGYVNTDNVVGSTAVWSVNSSVAQTITLGIRYGHNTVTGRPMSLSVNNTVQVANIPFAATGTNTWVVTNVQITLAAGVNSVKLTSLASIGSPYLDELVYNSESVSAGSCVTTPNEVPTVSITSPVSGTTYTALASVTINASAADADGTISSVQFFNGTTLLGTDNTAPYSFVWSSVAQGTYSIIARATDNSGAVATSDAVSIVVNPAPPNILPQVSITAPVEGTTYTAPAGIVITAVASDSDGTISTVQFYRGTTLLGSDATSPYSFTISGATAGTYAITARATDNSGGVTTSAIVNVTVNPAPNQAPTVSITAPANNATFTAPASVTITASATDVDGTISNVQFYNGTTLLGSDATSPYSFAWTSVAAGTYTITAVATDNSAATTTSAPISISVAAAPVGDIVGPNCGTRNTTATFELSAANKVNATTYQWWYTGSSQSVTPQATDRSKVTVVYGANFTAGQLCAGVNYSVAPWFKQYCKAISVCAAKFDPSFTEADLVETTEIIIAPNPSLESFTITMPAAVESYEVYNNLGAVIFKGSNIGSGESIVMGEQFAAGLYTLSVHYADQTTETKRIQKLK